MLGVTLQVALDLATPVIGIRCWRAAAARTIVTMPKTTVYEDGFVLADESHIGLAGEFLAVKSIA
jgi:hypothetical protein